jgi:hypothetical protein
MMDCGPIDAGYPAVFFFRKGYDPIREQFIQLALAIQIIRIQSEDQSLAQLHLLLREVLDRSDTIQANSALRIRVVEIGVDFWLPHAASPFIMAS